MAGAAVLSSGVRMIPPVVQSGDEKERADRANEHVGVGTQPHRHAIKRVHHRRAERDSSSRHPSAMTRSDKHDQYSEVRQQEVIQAVRIGRDVKGAEPFDVSTCLARAEQKDSPRCRQISAAPFQSRVSINTLFTNVLWGHLKLFVKHLQQHSFETAESWLKFG